MKLSARIGFSMLLVSVITLAPAVMAAECGQKDASSVNQRSDLQTKNIVSALTTTAQRGSNSRSGAAR